MRLKTFCFRILFQIILSLGGLGARVSGLMASIFEVCGLAVLCFVL